MTPEHVSAAGDHRLPALLFVVNVAWFFLSHRLPLAQAASAAGYVVHLASDVEDAAEAQKVRCQGIEFHRLHLARSGMNPWRELRTRQQLRSIVRRLRPHIVHNVTAKPIIHGTAVAEALGVPGVVNAVSGFGHVYSSGRHLLRGVLDRAYARAFRPGRVRIIVQNEVDRAEVLRLCPAAAARIRLICGSGVDLAAFRPAPEPPGTPTVLMPARLLREKGVREFAAAAALLRAEGVAARFILAGRLDPGNRGALSAAEVERLSRSGMEWIGEQHDMPRCLREAHIVCLPSYREGMPKVLLEACAAGRPIVTTDSPGCRDVVHEGDNGLLVPVRDAAALARAIGCLLADASLRVRMGLRGRARAEQEYGIENVLQAHLQLYREFAVARDAGRDVA